MVCKFINWIKDNCWIIVGILLAGNIIYVYFSDKPKIRNYHPIHD